MNLNYASNLTDRVYAPSVGSSQLLDVASKFDFKVGTCDLDYVADAQILDWFKYCRHSAPAEPFIRTLVTPSNVHQ